MSQLRSIERLSLILEFVNRKKYPSFNLIAEFLSNHDIIASERTIQRDFKTLRELCFIEVKFDRFQKGYYIDEDHQRDFQEWMHVFELFNTARVINDTLVKSSSNIDYIDFDRTHQFSQNDILSKSLKAVVEKRKIQFVHQSFWTETPKTINLQPHLLKQYLNRWYLFGCFPDGTFRSFGLERITEMTVHDDTFKVKMKKPKLAFDEVVGLVFSLNELQTVVLSYSPVQGKYIKTQPIHSSQKILIDNKDELRIQIRVRPNYELEEQIMKQGERVTVIEPEGLRKAIHHRLKLALEKYN
jgi:predicted DNA-binding transcriptional regulator YafY